MIFHKYELFSFFKFFKLCFKTFLTYGIEFNIRILIYRISFMITQIMELVIYIDILIFNLIKNVFILRKRFFIGFFY